MVTLIFHLYFFILFFTYTVSVICDLDIVVFITTGAFNSLPGVGGHFCRQHFGAFTENRTQDLVEGIWIEFLLFGGTIVAKQQCSAVIILFVIELGRPA